MNKYKMCGGFAIQPEKDMEMLHEMSLKGWHLKAMSGVMYKLEKGEPKPYIYSLNMEDSVDEDMLSLYRESGWEEVVFEQGYQIFRAEEGTPPIFSDKESQIEVVKNQQKQFGKASAITFAILVVCFVLAEVLNFSHVMNGVMSVAVCIALGSFVITFMPFVGLHFVIRRIKKNN